MQSASRGFFFFFETEGQPSQRQMKPQGELARPLGVKQPSVIRNAKNKIKHNKEAFYFFVFNTSKCEGRMYYIVAKEGLPAGLIFAPVTARHMSNFRRILPQLVTRQKNVKLNLSKDIKLLKCPSNDRTQSEMTCHRFNFTSSLHSSTNHLKFPTGIHSC
jgi:hypothetical protein